MEEFLTKDIVSTGDNVKQKRQFSEIEMVMINW